MSHSPLFDLLEDTYFDALTIQRGRAPLEADHIIVTGRIWRDQDREQYSIRWALTRHQITESVLDEITLVIKRMDCQIPVELRNQR